MAAAEILGVRSLHLQRENEELAPAQEEKDAYAPEEHWIQEQEAWI